ncbi:MAG TPA: UDP-3-O-(3-hydroxymyristoyl)glucosamine N-acyltransferase [Burkholderiales bacterium]
MTTHLKQPVSAGWLCRSLGLPLFGPDRDIRSICALESLAEDGLSFVLPGRALDPARSGTVFARKELPENRISVIGSQDPRLDFIRAQYILAKSPGFEQPAAPPQVHPSVRIAPGAVVEPGVVIGEGTVVGPNAVIRSGSRIGRFCEIKSGAVIGDSGFGFERDLKNRPLRMIHLGGVRIGDHVEIGALSTVVQGALEDTILEDYVKVNDHVHIAHNCHVGEASIIGGGAYLSGSIKVGRNCWIAPNCSIRQKLRIGEAAIVGIGAVVVHDVEPGSMVYGNPAKKASTARIHSPTGVLPLHK